ncbi:TPA: ProQ/FinO family protein [Serratia liquefaciens]|nr:ProQ/FinO family protein [Serratia liquefaciens]
MSTMYEQLQQVKQQMGQGKPAAAQAHKVDSAKNATSGTTTGAALNPWVVKPKHRQSAPQPAAVQNGDGKAKRISVNNRKKIKKLMTHWPALFSLDVARPLSVGIQAALIADAKARGLAITESQITYCLSTYAKRPAYLKALSAGGPRYDLHGQPCGEVTAEQQQKALIQLEGMRKANGTTTQQAG